MVLDSTLTGESASHVAGLCSLVRVHGCLERSSPGPEGYWWVVPLGRHPEKLAVDELSWFCSLLGRDQFEKEGGVAAIRASPIQPADVLPGLPALTVGTVRPRDTVPCNGEPPRRQRR